MANYLNNKELLEQIIISKEQGKMTDTLARMFILLTNKIAKHPRFFRYTEIDEMKSCALVRLCETWHKFDETKYQNAFAYFTTVAWNAFHQYLKGPYNRYETAKQELRKEIPAIGGRTFSQQNSDEFNGHS